MSFSDRLAAVSLVVAVLALIVSLGVALYTVWRADKTASAGALIALQTSLDNAWREYLHANEEDEQSYRFAELLNLLETSCALYLNRSFTSSPREIMKSYLNEVFEHLAESDVARARLKALAARSDTFDKIKQFERENRRSLSLSKPLFVTNN